MAFHTYSLAVLCTMHVNDQMGVGAQHVYSLRHGAQHEHSLLDIFTVQMSCGK